MATDDAQGVDACQASAESSGPAFRFDTEVKILMEAIGLTDTVKGSTSYQLAVDYVVAMIKLVRIEGERQGVADMKKLLEST